MDLHEILQAVGAFLSGAGAVAASFWALKRVRAADEEECEKRFAAFREGLKYEEERRDSS